MVAKTAIISATFVVFVIIAVIAGIYLARRQERIRAREQGLPIKGDLSAAQEAILLSQLHEAATIMRRLGRNDDTNFGDPEILRTDTKIDVGRWLTRYDKTVNKERVSQ